MPPISNHRATPSPRKEKEIYPNQFTFARYTLITLTEETLPPLPATESIITIDQSPFLLSLFPIIEKNQRAYPPLRSGIDYARIYERHGDTLSRGEWAIIQLSFVENSYARRIVAGRGTARRGRTLELEIQARMYPRRITILVTRPRSHYIRPVRRVFPTWRLPVCQAPLPS